MGADMSDMVPCDADTASTVTVPDPENVEWRVRSHADTIFSRIDALALQAATLRSAAESAYSSVTATLTESLPDAQFNAAISAYTTLTQDLPDAPSLAPLPDIDVSAIGNMPDLVLDSLVRSSIAAPAIDTLSFPDVPSVSTLVAAPTPLAYGSLPDAPPPPPSTIFEISPLPSIEGLPSFALSPITLNWAPYLPPVYSSVGVPSISADRVSTAVARTFVPDGYMYRVLQDAIITADTLLDPDNGYFVTDALAAAAANLNHATGVHAARTLSVWSRRGFDRDDISVRSAYAANVASRANAELSTQHLAAVRRNRIKHFDGILRSAVSSHAAMAEIKRQLYELDFALLATVRQEQIRLISSMVDQVRAKLMQFSFASAQYAMLVKQIQANVEAHLNTVKAEVLKGRVNEARASAYTATQEAQSAQVQAYEAHYQAALAIVEAYNTMMRTMQAQAQTATAALAQFEAQSEEWGAQLLAAKAEFDVRAQQNQAIVAQNQSLVSQVAVNAASADIVAAEASALSADIASQAAQMRAVLAQRVADYMQAEQHNRVAAAKVQQQAQQDQLAVIQFEAGALPLRGLYSAYSAINDAATGGAVAIGQALASTARDLQTQRVQLANAYINMYKALADAEASRVTGQASRVRADVRLAARGDVAYTSQTSKRLDKSESASATKSNECVTVFRPLTY